MIINTIIRIKDTLRAVIFLFFLEKIAHPIMFSIDRKIMSNSTYNNPPVISANFEKFIYTPTINNYFKYISY